MNRGEKWKGVRGGRVLEVEGCQRWKGVWAERGLEVEGCSGRFIYLLADTERQCPRCPQRL